MSNIRPRVIYAHAPGLLKPQVLDFLASQPIDLEVREHEPEEGYYQLLAELWAQAQDFILCEWDVLPYPGALEEIWACQEQLGFCGKPYRLFGWYAASLGCTKFPSELMRRYPRAVVEAGKRPGLEGWGPGFRHWQAFDSRLFAALLELGFGGDLEAGYPHQHYPIVSHLRDYPGWFPPFRLSKLPRSPGLEVDAQP
jgi:hypothetical protein